MPNDESRAARVLRSVVHGFPPPNGGNGYVRLLDGWVGDQDTICVVYEGWWSEGKLGLRRRIETHLTVEQEAANILDGELGEPPGSMIEGATPDEDGITWWEGDRPEWRLYQ